MQPNSLIVAENRYYDAFGAQRRSRCTLNTSKAAGSQLGGFVGLKV